jgi:hypothetical protein
MQRESSLWSSPRQDSRRYSRRSTPSTELRQILIRKESNVRTSLGAGERGSGECGTDEQRSYEHKSINYN